MKAFIALLLIVALTILLAIPYADQIYDNFKDIIEPEEYEENEDDEYEI